MTLGSCSAKWDFPIPAVKDIDSQPKTQVLEDEELTESKGAGLSTAALSKSQHRHDSLNGLVLNWVQRKLESTPHPEMFRTSYLQVAGKENDGDSDPFNERSGTDFLKPSLGRLQEFNECFSKYVNRARAIEQSSAALEKQLESLRQIEELSGLESVFTEQIDHNQQKIWELLNDLNRLEKELKDAQRTLDEYRTKYRTEYENHEQLQDTFENLNKNANEALLKNLELQIRTQFLQEHINSTKERNRKNLAEIQDYMNVLKDIHQPISCESSTTLSHEEKDLLLAEDRGSLMTSQFDDYRGGPCQLTSQRQSELPPEGQNRRSWLVPDVAQKHHGTVIAFISWQLAPTLQQCLHFKSSAFQITTTRCVKKYFLMVSLVLLPIILNLVIWLSTLLPPVMCSNASFTNNRKAECFLKAVKLVSVAVQRDLGVLVRGTQQVSMEVQQAIRKANGMLAFSCSELKPEIGDHLMAILEQTIKENYLDQVQSYREQIEDLRKKMEEAEKNLEECANECRQVVMYQQSLEDELESYKRFITKENYRLQSTLTDTQTTPLPTSLRYEYTDSTSATQYSTHIKSSQNGRSRKIAKRKEVASADTMSGNGADQECANKPSEMSEDRKVSVDEDDEEDKEGEFYSEEGEEDTRPDDVPDGAQISRMYDALCNIVRDRMRRHKKPEPPVAEFYTKGHYVLVTGEASYMDPFFCTSVPSRSQVTVTFDAQRSPGDIDSLPQPDQPKPLDYNGNGDGGKEFDSTKEGDKDKSGDKKQDDRQIGANGEPKRPTLSPSISPSTPSPSEPSHVSDYRPMPFSGPSVPQPDPYAPGKWPSKDAASGDKQQDDEDRTRIIIPPQPPPSDNKHPEEPKYRYYEKIEMTEAVETFTDNKLQGYSETSTIVETTVEKTTQEKREKRS
ncbi:filensin [Heterodontus francisci]|uniref:filensin n=1 Tax=Heterodontus francisci TaxID=7792 RepID=UPI00355C501A